MSPSPFASRLEGLGKAASSIPVQSFATVPDMTIQNRSKLPQDIPSAAPVAHREPARVGVDRRTRPAGQQAATHAAPQPPAPADYKIKPFIQ